ncbi:MAG: HAMP domain-containing protein [Nitrospirae bacterium]|nr:HAMP domain-containing protein [Nitrospirota bacterium]
MKNIKGILIVFAIFVITFIVTILQLKYLGIKEGPLFSKVALLIFININILSLLLLIFFVTRGLSKLYFERKQKVIGSRFRTKLVVAFVGLTLIPSILLFVVSSRLITNSINKWFSLEIHKPIKDSMEVARSFYTRERERALSYAKSISSGTGEFMEALPERSAPFTDKSYRVIRLKKPDGSDIVKNAFNGTADTEVISVEAGDVIRAAAPVRTEDGISGVVVVETVLPRGIVNKMEAIRRAHNEYSQLETFQSPIKLLYFLVLTIATLLIVFLALWVSLRIAKGITVPIKELAEATNAVAHGNMDFRIDTKREDEIGFLIDSFNSMVEELKDGKRSLEHAYIESDRRRLSMEAILENINTGVIFLENSGRVVTINNAACSILNLNSSDTIGKSYKEILELIKSEDLNPMIKRLGEKDSSSVEKEIHAHINGRPVTLRIYLTALKDSRGEAIGTLVVFDDLTEIIKAQKALAWQEVAKRIAHEIKNPLTPIKLSTERIMKKWDEKAGDFEEVLKRATRTIVKEVDGLRGLVDEFSRFGKLPIINPVSCNINSVVEEVVDLYKDFKDITIITFLEDIPKIEVDREQIKRALINLIDNAIQAKAERILLNTYYEPAVGLAKIEVIDDGTGIKEEDKDKLFLPYFSTKKGGTGLGLAMVNRIITEHRGYIRVKDNEPEGTRFIIELPLKR